MSLALRVLEGLGFEIIDTKTGEVIVVVEIRKIKNGHCLALIGADKARYLIRRKT